MARDFLPYNTDQQFLLPPDMREWVPEDHLIWFLSDVVDGLDLSAIFATYQKDDLRGRAGYHPAMMVKLLLYAYCLGKTSSRKIERATYEEVPFRVLSADQHPDHDVLSKVSPPAPLCPRRPLPAGPQALPSCRSRETRARGAGRHQGEGQRLPSQSHELRAYVPKGRRTHLRGG